MSSASIQAAGILLTHYVKRLEANGKINGNGNHRTNPPEESVNENGIYDEMAACLETIAARSCSPSFRESVDDAADQIRRTDPVREDPERIPNVILTFVTLIGALIAAEG
jgi:hypothetical protein